MMAAGKRPVPFRTRKLSPPAPMVLPPGGSGRVGYRRPNNFTHSTRHTNPHGLCGGCLCFCHARTLPRCRLVGWPTQLSALRTPTPAPTPHCGQQPRHPSLVSTHELYESTQHPNRLKAHLGKRGGVVDSCTTGAPHGLLVALTLADSALRTTTAPPTMGVHQRVGWRGSGGLVKVDNSDPRPGETQSENRSLVNFCDTNPAGDPCGLRVSDNNGPTNNGCAPRVCKTRRHHHRLNAPISTNTPRPDDFYKAHPRAEETTRLGHTPTPHCGQQHRHQQWVQGNQIPQAGFWPKRVPRPIRFGIRRGWKGECFARER